MRHPRIRRYLRHGTFPQLAVFEASARLSSFTRAANELHLAQPTVSAQIRKLSETVGAPLFAQVGRQIHLTEAGRRLQARCADLFRVLDDLEGDLALLREPASGRLSIGTCGAAEHFVARLLAHFGERHPGVEATLVIGNHAQLAERIASGADDLTLLATLPRTLPLVRQAVAANPLAVMAATGDPLASERRIAFSRIAAHAFVMRELGSATRAATEQAFATRGLRPQVRMTLSSHHAVREAVRAGHGLALLPLYAFGPDDERGGLVALDTEGFPLPGAWQLVYPVGASLSATAQAFLDHARDACARFTEDGPAPRNWQRTVPAAA